MPTNKDSSVQIAAIVAVLLAGVGGAWLFLSSGNDEAVEAGQISTSVASSGEVKSNSLEDVLPIDTALQMAEMAFQSGQLADSEDGGALDFYKQVLTQDPENARALAGMRLISSQLKDEANDFMAKGNYAEVVDRIKLMNKIEAGSNDVLALQQQLVDKAESMFQEMDSAIASNRLARAEELAKSLRVIPDADTGRISASLVTIAQKRKENEARARAPAVVETVEPNNLPETQSVASFSNTRSTNDLEIESVTTGTLSAGSVSTPEQFEAAPIDTTATRVAELLSIATTRVENNRLFTPESDSALNYFNQVLSLDESNTEAKRGLRGLVQRTTSRAYSLARATDFDGARAALDQAAAIGLATELVEQARSDVNQQYIAAESQKVVSIGSFEIERTVPPKYPGRAIDRSVEGWVRIEFTVTENGSTSDLTVTESSDRYSKQFSRAAMDAVSQWRFKPRMIDGQAIAQRSQTTVQFKLN